MRPLLFFFASLLLMLAPVWDTRADGDDDPIDKFRTYDVVTTTTEVWIYDELPGGPYMHEEPLPRVTVTHSTAKGIAMNWGFSYDSEAGTDGDDIWFTLTDWNIFGNTYQYDRTMYYNFQQMTQ